MQDTIEKDGEIVPRYKTLSNGAVYDLQAGRICANPGGGTTAITQANTSEYRARKHKKFTRAAASGVALAIAAGHGIEGTPGNADAWQLAAAQVAEGFFSDKYRDRTDAMRALAPVVDAVYEKGNAQAQQAAPAQQVNVDNLLVMQVMQQRGTMESGDVIDGSVQEDGEDKGTQKKP